jgi:hypothetical protein
LLKHLDKNAVTFSDVITGLGRWIWGHWAFAMMSRNKGFQKLSRRFRNMLLDALAPAA